MMYSKDGKFLFYEDGNGGMHRVNLQSRKAETIMTMKDLARPSMPYWPSWSGLAPDGSILAMRNTGTKEIYSLEWQP